MDEPQDKPARDERGRILSGGRTLNPGGQRRIPAEIVEMLKAGSPKAAQTLVDALDADRGVQVGSGDSATLEMVPDWPTRIKAASILHDRLYGKPVQEITGENGEPLIPQLSLASLTPEQLAVLDTIRTQKVLK